MFQYFLLRALTNRLQINNAGILLQEKEVNSEGLCSHLATNTLAPFYLTLLLIPTLRQWSKKFSFSAFHFPLLQNPETAQTVSPPRKSEDPRVIFVSAGGMLAESLQIRDEYEQQNSWDGLSSYARTKVFFFARDLILANQFLFVIAQFFVYFMSLTLLFRDTLQYSLKNLREGFQPSIFFPCTRVGWTPWACSTAFQHFIIRKQSYHNKCGLYHIQIERPASANRGWIRHNQVACDFFFSPTRAKRKILQVIPCFSYIYHLWIFLKILFFLFNPDYTTQDCYSDMGRDRGEEIKYLAGASSPSPHLARGLWDWCEDLLGISPTEDAVFLS